MIRPLQAPIAEMLQGGWTWGRTATTKRTSLGWRGPELAFEAAHSNRIIEDRIGHEISTMAYPFGRHKAHVSPHVLEAVRRAGYAFAGTTEARG